MFFNWLKASDEPKTYAITSTTKICGTFYVDKRGNNVCCPMDSAQSNGKDWGSVNNNLKALRKLYPDRSFDIVEI